MEEYDPFGDCSDEMISGEYVFVLSFRAPLKIRGLSIVTQDSLEVLKNYL